MRKEIEIHNLHCDGCGGCATTTSRIISNELSMLEGISNASVDKDTSIVSFESNNENMNKVLDLLNRLGFPRVDDINSSQSQAKSVMSCIIGSVS